MMKKRFKVEKLELDSLINLLIELYDSGVDYIDLFSDNKEVGQDKLIIQTRDEYMNPEWVAKNAKIKRLPAPEDTKLTDESLNDLI